MAEDDAAQQIADFQNAAHNAIGSTIRICLAINGGALIALMAFLGSMAQAGQALPRTGMILYPFAIGVIAAGLSALAMGGALNKWRNGLYLQHRQGKWAEATPVLKGAENLAGTAFYLVCLSLLAASVGFVAAISVFDQLPPAPDRTVTLEASAQPSTLP